jgi:hypothetical protein
MKREGPLPHPHNQRCGRDEFLFLWGKKEFMKRKEE